MAKILSTGNYCMYLRRSRADMEEEKRGSGETLTRHYVMLKDLAKRLGIFVADDAVYREIVSGDTIAARPQMQQLLADVEQGMWDGVLVTEMSRLARGDTVDQGIVANTFLYSNTLIITPQKTYDMRDQADEEMAEMGLFMSRFEYRQIKRRLQAGRVNSVKQGLYVCSTTLYGYEKYKMQQQRGYSLRILPEQAAVVRMVYDWYLNGIDGIDVGCGRIAKELNNMGLRTNNGNFWQEVNIRKMLQNPTYCGKVWWSKNMVATKMKNGVRVKTRVPTTPIIVEGKHEAIISEEVWDRVQEQMKRRTKVPNTTTVGTRNPFAGLMKCSECGCAMAVWHRVHDESKKAYLLRCNTPGCKTSACYLYVVENAVLAQLNEWVREFDRPEGEEPEKIRQDGDENAALAAAEKTIAGLNKQLSRIRDLLEQGVYTVDVYLERQKEIQTRIDETNAQIEILSAPAPISTEDAIRASLPKIKSFLEAYDTDAPAETKNQLFKSVIGRIVYHKTEINKRNDVESDKLVLDIYPVFPKG